MGHKQLPIQYSLSLSSLPTKPYTVCYKIRSFKIMSGLSSAEGSDMSIFCGSVYYIHIHMYKYVQITAKNILECYTLHMYITT